MRIEFIIEPHRGIGPVSFGMTRQEATEALARVGAGPPRARGERTACYFGASFQVTFGNGGRADFIEIASGIPASVIFVGRDVCDTPADELLALVEEFDQFAPELSRPPGQYIFPRLILTLWGRDSQYDKRATPQREMFAAVGLGGPTYLEAIRAIYQGRG
jgi:hypothetical protein